MYSCEISLEREKSWYKMKVSPEVLDSSPGS